MVESHGRVKHRSSAHKRSIEGPLQIDRSAMQQQRQCKMRQPMSTCSDFTHHRKVAPQQPHKPYYS